MSNTSVYAISESQHQAENIVSRLKTEGFANNRISVLFPDKSSTADFAHEKNTKAPEGAVTGGVSGGVLGGTLGWIAGIGALAIPGVGPFIAAGPLAAAVGGAFAGATLGSIAGALVGMGIPEIEAKRFESKVKDGNILISVHAKDSDEVSLAKKILKEHDASDICTASMDKGDSDTDADSDHHDRDRDRDRIATASGSGAYAAKSHPADRSAVEQQEKQTSPIVAGRH